MSKEPLYPHTTKKSTNKNRVRKTATAVDGSTVRSINEYKIIDIDATLQSYFNIGAKKITIEYDTLIVEWALVSE